MKTTNSVKRIIVMLALLFTPSLFAQPAGPNVAINLGTATNFGLLAGSGITNASAQTTITGDVGSSPNPAVTGLTASQVNGTLYTAPDPATDQAQLDLTVAYDEAAGAPCGTVLTGTDLGGLTLVPGVYCFSSSAQLTGTLTLDGQGDPNAQWVFQIGSTLTTATDSSVLLINGGAICNVYWQIGSSATLGTNTTFVGNILALTSITLNGGTLNGRALARNGAVTISAAETVTANPCQCVLGVSVGKKVIHAGDNLGFVLNLQHRRAETVQRGFVMTILDKTGNTIATQQTTSYTLHQGDVLHLSQVMLVPAGTAPGQYTLHLGISGMTDGMARAIAKFSVIE
ncbi:MAG: DUF3494 domain-containing protein [Acidobacteriales bacterium]|nr:DUF3494 domain-containing protein [Terriglobales bacterium]